MAAARHLQVPEPTPRPTSPPPAEGTVIKLDGRRPAAVSGRQREQRRRFVALVSVSLLALGLVALVQSIVTSERASVPTLEPLSAVDEGDVYVVQQGDTLWTIARRLAPDDDPRPLVAEMRARNGGAEVAVGDRLDLARLSEGGGGG